MSQKISDIHESKVKFVTLSEACQLLRRCRQTVVKLIEEGEIYGTNKGGRWLIERASIETALNTIIGLKAKVEELEGYNQRMKEAIQDFIKHQEILCELCKKDTIYDESMCIECASPDVLLKGYGVLQGGDA